MGHHEEWQQGSIEDRRGEFATYAENALKNYQTKIVERMRREKRIDLISEAWKEFMKAVASGRVPCEHRTFMSFVGNLINRHMLPEEQYTWRPVRVWRRALSHNERYGGAQ